MTIEQKFIEHNSKVTSFRFKLSKTIRHIRLDIRFGKLIPLNLREFRAQLAALKNRDSGYRIEVHLSNGELFLNIEKFKDGWDALPDDADNWPPPHDHILWYDKRVSYFHYVLPSEMGAYE